MDKIIFLDIDGVLNAVLANGSQQGEINDGTLIDENKVILLGELVKKTGAKLVLHSGWRFWFDNSIKPIRSESVRLAEMLQKHGMQIFDITPDYTTEEIRKTKKFSLIKAKEILGWLEQHTEIKSWIVIDDLDLHNELISQHQVKTQQTIGLTRQDVEKAEKMLLSKICKRAGSVSEKKYPAIKPEFLSGDKPLLDAEGKQIAKLVDYWSWAHSDLVGNTERGGLAEYIVACALEIQNNERVAWDKYDLLSNEGIAVEVKTSGYIQTWEQERLSNITFGIQPTYGWNSETNVYDTEQKRQSD